MGLKKFTLLGSLLFSSFVGFAFSHNHFTETHIKKIESDCLDYSIFSITKQGTESHQPFEQAYSLIEQHKAIPWYTVKIDNKTIVIGGLTGDLICNEQCNTLSYLMYQKYLSLGGPTVKPLDIAINTWNNFICSIPLFAEFATMFKDFVCSMPFITWFLECDVCSDDTFYVFAIDITDPLNAKGLWSIKLDHYSQSGPIVFKFNGKFYVGFSYVEADYPPFENKPEYKLNLKLIPLEEKPTKSAIKTVTLVSYDKPIVEGKLYTTGLDWNLDNKTDALIIPYFKAEDDQGTNWKTEIAIVKPKGLFESFEEPVCKNGELCKVKDINQNFLTEIPLGFIYGKPYIFVGTTERTNIDPNHLVDFKPDNFYAISLCKNNRCSFENIDISPSDQVTINVNLDNLDGQQIDSGNCKEFVKNHKSLKFRLQGSCLQSADFSSSYIEKGYATFLAATPSDGKYCGINLKLDTIEYKPWGAITKNKAGFYAFIHRLPTNHEILVPTQEGKISLKLQPNGEKTEVTLSGDLHVTEKQELIYEYSYGNEGSNSHSSSNIDSDALKEGKTFEVTLPAEVGVYGIHPLPDVSSSGSKNKILLWLEY